MELEKHSLKHYAYVSEVRYFKVITTDWEIFNLKTIHIKKIRGVKFSRFCSIHKFDGYTIDEHLESC